MWQTTFRNEMTALQMFTNDYKCNWRTKLFKIEAYKKIRICTIAITAIEYDILEKIDFQSTMKDIT